MPTGGFGANGVRASPERASGVRASPERAAASFISSLDLALTFRGKFPRSPSRPDLIVQFQRDEHKAAARQSAALLQALVIAAWACA